MSALELRGVVAKAGPFQLRLDVTLRESVTGIFGPSGSGKSTLLEIIAGLRTPAAGRIEMQGRVLFDAVRKIAEPARRRRIGYVPQDLALFPHLRVRQNIAYGRQNRAPGAHQFSADAVCETLQIASLLERYPDQLSGGERQRVAFARALLAGPELLLFDEPLASLDQELKARIIPYLARIRDEFRVPMIYVSHAPGEIAELCRDVIVLRGGEVVAQGPPARLFERIDVPNFRLRTDLPASG